jgi:hypothetical protein
MISGARIFLGLIVRMGAPLALVFAPGAMAQGRMVTGSQDKGWQERWLALDHCAAYGPEFTSVEGTETCVRIGGRVRVEFGAQSLHNAGRSGWGGAGTAPAAMRTEGPLSDGPADDFPQARHLRLRQHMRLDDAPTYGGYYLR